MRTSIVLASVAAALMIGQVVVAGGVVPNPVANGGFELFVPPEVGDNLADTPADECIGIGHQVNYGDQTVQHKLLDEDDPEGAAAQLADDPEGEALFLSGYGYCVWSDAEGKDSAWINPRNMAADDAVQWSAQNMVAGDHDGDDDREALIPSGGPGHNMWQAYPNPHQAFTPNFDVLEFDVEAGEIHPGALIQISMITTPLTGVSPWVPIYLDCGFNFSGQQLLDHMDGNGHVAIPATEGHMFSRFVDCDEVASDYQAAKLDGDEAAQRAALGKTRIVQLSFWSFSRAAEDSACGCAILIDNVSLTGATTVAEEVAAGNFNTQLSPSTQGEIDGLVAEVGGLLE